MGTPTATTTTVGTAESIPAHMDAGDQLAAALTDAADNLRQLVDAATRHMEAAEALGITGSVLGGFSDTADAVRAAVDALTAAADTATATATAERQQLAPVVESVSGAPLTDRPTVGQLRAQ